MTSNQCAVNSRPLMLVTAHWSPVTEIERRHNIASSKKISSDGSGHCREDG